MVAAPIPANAAITIFVTKAPAAATILFYVFFPSCL